MKTVLFGTTGIGFAGWLAVESSLSVAQIGAETGVSAQLVIQLGFLLAAAVMLVKFGVLMADWKRSIDEAAKFGRVLADVEEKLRHMEARMKMQEAWHISAALMLEEHGVRLGIRTPPSALEEGG